MEKRKNGQLIIIGVLAFAILFMSVGFAAYSQTLNIQGTATVNVVAWSVHWKNASLQTANDSVTLTSSSLSNTDVSFAGTLTKPGDKIHFTVVAINDGDFDAYLKKITMTALDTAQSKYLTFTVKFDGTTYTQTTDNLSTQLLKTSPNNEKTAEIIVEYIQPNDPSDLPTAVSPATSVDVSFTVNFDFEQLVSS